MADATQGDFLMAAKARNQSPAVPIQWNENSIRLAEEEAAANPRMKIDEPKTRRDPEMPASSPPLGYSEAMRRYHESQTEQRR